MGKKLSRNELHEKLGLQQSQDFSYTDAPGYRVYQYGDSPVIKLFEIKDQIGDATLLEYVEKKVEGAKARRTAAQQAADEKRSEIEQRRKAEAAKAAAQQAEASEKLDRELTLRLKGTNPAISEEEIKSLLPEMRRRHFLDQAERAKALMFESARRSF